MIVLDLEKITNFGAAWTVSSVALNFSAFVEFVAGCWASNSSFTAEERFSSSRMPTRDLILLYVCSLDLLFSFST